MTNDATKLKTDDEQDGRLKRLGMFAYCWTVFWTAHWINRLLCAWMPGSYYVYNIMMCHTVDISDQYALGFWGKRT